jgi:LysM repeat protein
MNKVRLMWYTVQTGDSIFSIAHKFRITSGQLIAANQILGSTITPGQLLFIPIQVSKVITYTVKPGDSLYKIARQFNTLVESIMVLNRLTGPNLEVGQRLVIPQYTEAVVNVGRANVRSGPGTNNTVITTLSSGSKLPVTEVSRDWFRVGLHNGRSGWISRNVTNFRTYDGSKPIQNIIGFYTLSEGPALPGSFRSFADNTTRLTELPLFMYRFDRNNPTTIAKFGEFPDTDVEMLVAIAHRNNIMILPVVHNLLYESGGQETSRQVIKTMVATPQSRATAISNIVALIERFGFDGVNIDIAAATLLAGILVIV